jgi:hypothetical protein
LEGESASNQLAEVLAGVGRFGFRSRNLWIPQLLKEILTLAAGINPDRV